MSTNCPEMTWIVRLSIEHRFQSQILTILRKPDSILESDNKLIFVYENEFDTADQKVFFEELIVILTSIHQNKLADCLSSICVHICIDSDGCSTFIAVPCAVISLIADTKASLELFYT